MKTDIERGLKELQIRSFQIREFDAEKREVTGIAVPWGELADLGSFREIMERGAVQDSDDAQLWWRHQEPIGKLISNRDTDAGWEVTAKISQTARGDEALTLLRDGVVSKMSIGFESNEYTIREDDNATIVTHTNIHVREVSIVPLPAYAGAEVTQVREAPTNRKEDPPMGDTTAFATKDEVLEVRNANEDLERRFGMLQVQEREEVVVDTRSAGQILKAIVQGDEATIKAYNDLQERAYTGSTLADSVVKPQWVGDLTRIIDEAAPMLQLFAKGTLPAEGMTLEYAQLKSNTVAYDEQVAEGDDLPYGKVQIELKNAPVKTFGGWSELSFQAIQRSSVNVLQTTLEAQSVAAGKRMNVAMRAAVAAAHARETAANNVVNLGATLAAATYQDWINAIVDAAVAYDKLGLPLQGLIANTALFKGLAGMTANDGRPVLLIQGDGSNNIGTLNPSGLSASLANVTVALDAGLPTTATGFGAFVNQKAIRSYISPVARLQDENIINLTKQFSVYNYAAFAHEVPAAFVPVKFAAA